MTVPIATIWTPPNSGTVTTANSGVVRKLQNGTIRLEQDGVTQRVLQPNVPSGVTPTIWSETV